MVKALENATLSIDHVQEIEIMEMEDVTCLLIELDDVWLWHKRLCHVNFDNLISIRKMKKVRGLPKLKKPDNIMCK